THPHRKMPRHDPPELGIALVDERAETPEVALRVGAVLIVDEPRHALTQDRSQAFRKPADHAFYVRATNRLAGGCGGGGGGGLGGGGFAAPRPPPPPRRRRRPGWRP